MQMINVLQRLAELDADNPNVIQEGSIQQGIWTANAPKPGQPNVPPPMPDEGPTDGSTKPAGKIPPGMTVDQAKQHPAYKTNPKFKAEVDAASKWSASKPAPTNPGFKSIRGNVPSPDDMATSPPPRRESADLAECGPMGMMSGGMDHHTPASISMTADSGPELSGMLADIMKLAGVHQVEPHHLGIEPEHDHSDVEVISAEPTPIDGSDETEIMRSMMDRMNGEMDDEEEADEGMYDNSPADTAPPAPFDANEFAHRENQPDQGDRMDGDKPKAFATMEEQLMADWKQFMTEGVAEGEDWTGSLYDPDWLPKGKKKPKLSDIKVKFPPKKQEPKQQGVEPKKQGVSGGSKSTKTYNDGIEDSIELLKTLSGNSIDYIIDRLQDYQYAYEKKHGVAKGTGRMETYNDGIEDSIELLKTLSGNSIDYIIDRLQDYQYAYEKKQGVAEAAKWRHDDLEGKTWRSADWDDGDLSPGKIQIDRHGKDVDDSGDELNARPGMWGGKYKRMTKKGTPTQHELGMQNNTKMRMKMQNKKGGLTGPKGRLPEE